MSVRATVVLPWATGAVVAIALAIEAFSGGGLIFDRTRIVAGEWWRGWTGQFAHFGLSHLAWNLAVIVPAGVWAERLKPSRTRLYFLLAPVVIGLALFAFDRALEQFAGLSGIAAGLIVLLASVQLAESERRHRWFWCAVLILLGLKILVETYARVAIFVEFEPGGIQPVPLAHVVGVIVALGLQALAERRAPSRLS